MPTEGLSQSCAKHFGSPSAASTLVFVLLSKSSHGLYNLKIPNMYPLTPVTSDCLQHTFVGSQRDQRAARLIFYTTSGQGTFEITLLRFAVVSSFSHLLLCRFVGVLLLFCFSLSSRPLCFFSFVPTLSG